MSLESNIIANIRQRDPNQFISRVVLSTLPLVGQKIRIRREHDRVDCVVEEIAHIVDDYYHQPEPRDEGGHTVEIFVRIDRKFEMATQSSSPLLGQRG
jgi:hypothetical protein